MCPSSVPFFFLVSIDFFIYCPAVARKNVWRNLIESMTKNKIHQPQFSTNKTTSIKKVIQFFGVVFNHKTPISIHSLIHVSHPCKTTFPTYNFISFWYSCSYFLLSFQEQYVFLVLFAFDFHFGCSIICYDIA